MAALAEILAECDRLLEPETFDDHCPNGLQVQGRTEVRRIASGVSASAELFELAIGGGADLVLCHHGLFWEGDERRVRGALRERLRLLLAADVSLAAYHLPLDAHPQLGNNALIAAALELEQLEPFARHRGREIGVRGRFAGGGRDAGELHAQIAALTRREPVAFSFGPDPLRSLAIVSGGGASHLRDALDAGVDGLLTGEPEEWARALAREERIHFIAAGHHATETFGVHALGSLLAERFELTHLPIEIENPV